MILPPLGGGGVRRLFEVGKGEKKLNPIGKYTRLLFLANTNQIVKCFWN